MPKQKQCFAFLKQNMHNKFLNKTSVTFQRKYQYDKKLSGDGFEF